METSSNTQRRWWWWWDEDDDETGWVKKLKFLLLLLRPLYRCVCPLRIKHEMSFFPSHSDIFYIIFVANTGEGCCYFLWTSYDVDFHARGLNVNFFTCVLFPCRQKISFIIFIPHVYLLHAISLELFFHSFNYSTYLFIYRIFKQ